MTQAQLDKFKTAIGWSNALGNFRPAQPIGQRTVEGCAEVAWYPYKASNWATQVGSEKSNAICLDGTAQSPIDFTSCTDPEDRDAIGITWEQQNVILKNNGHAVQLDASGTTTGKMTVGDKSYTLVQCHFHWGSEHQVSGYQYPFEVHCVHTKDGEDGRYGVFGLFYTLGNTENAFLKKFEDQLPSASRRLSSESAEVSFDLMGNPMDNVTKRRLGTVKTSAYTGPLDFKELYGSNARTHFWNYEGSFTTPPCTEAVDFYIMMEPAVMTQAQLDKFKTAIGWSNALGNFRPPQPIGKRTVSGCGNSGGTEETSGASPLRAAGALSAIAAVTAAGFSV